jgi:FkbM family methyltransferase
VPRTPYRLLASQWILRHWPFPRGRTRLERTLLKGFERWPLTADIDFRFGRLIDVSVAPWPRGYRDLFLHGVMERSEVALWQKAVRRGDVVIDAGANVGYWSLVAAALVAPGGRVLAFEPFPATAASLRANIQASNRGDVVDVFELALADRTARLNLHAHADDPIHGTASLGHYPRMTVSTELEVEARALDDVLEHHGLQPALLKLDIEGGELAALRGASRLLASSAPPIITIEWNVAASAGMGHHPMEFLELLRVHGYDFYLDTGGRLEPFSARESADWIPMIWCLPRIGPYGFRLHGIIRGRDAG